MNLNKTLAALMVATASLMVAPMATANDLTCGTGTAMPVEPTLKTLSNGAEDKFAFGVPVAGGSVEVVSTDDVRVTIWKVDTSDSSKCHLYSDALGAVANRLPGVFALGEGEYRIIITDFTPLAGDEQYTISGQSA